MNQQESINFLFNIATEIKRSLGTPVILITNQDYAENVFKALLNIRSALIQSATPDRIAEMVNEFHLEWLTAVSEIDSFKKRIRDTPREHISKSIDFTVECGNRRIKYFHNLIEQLKITMSAEENQLMQDDLEIMSEMHDNYNSKLRDKQKDFYTLVDATEYYYKVLDETEEQLYWLDTLYDNLAIQISKVIGLRFPELTTHLNTTLNQIIDEVSKSAPTEEDAQTVTQEIINRSRTLSAMIHLNYSDNLEIRKIVEKIKALEDRIHRLKTENSSAVMALQHKTIFLEERLMSLENLRQSMLKLKQKNDDGEKRAHIFDHLLPAEVRCRLVENLVKLWTIAITHDEESRSIISILSVADIKEVFTDELGSYTVDKYGRKLYKADDGKLYQVNENNELVSLEDDDKRVYFYDDCGRYFYNDKNQRIYKAHENASEYCMNREGLMLKMKEYREGKEYWYDNLGRYYLDERGKRIYCDTDGQYYENDGLGNLVRVRSFDDALYQVCPRGPEVTEDSKYLRHAVGVALKKCIAQVMVRQPVDPVLFLAMCLETYRRVELERQRRCEDECELRAERDRRMQDAYDATTAAATPCTAQGEQSYELDSNFLNYG